MTQVPNVTLKVGDVEVTAIYDMDFDVDRDRIFPSIAAEEWTGLEDFLTAEGKVRLTIVSYLIRSQGKTILCDTGLGVVPGTQQPGALMDGLRAAGAAPEDIDTVIFTHLHGDHTGWNITKVDGEPRLTFPNARYLIHELEWRHSSSPERASNPAFIERLQPLEPLGALTLLSGERTALTDEVTAVSTFGHTPGHVSLEIQSNGEEMLVQGDVVVHHVLLARTEWTPRFDFEPEGAKKLRDQELKRWSDEHLLVAANHFPAPGFGYVEPDGDAWRWVPRA